MSEGQLPPVSNIDALFTDVYDRLKAMAKRHLAAAARGAPMDHVLRSDRVARYRARFHAEVTGVLAMDGHGNELPRPNRTWQSTERPTGHDPSEEG